MPQLKPATLTAVRYDREGNIDWTPVMAVRGADARRLCEVFVSQVRDHLGTVQYALLGTAIAGLNRVHGSHYLTEARQMSRLLSVEERDIFAANLAYDLSNAAGCSTMLVATPEGPLHARNMDWSFPEDLLRKTTYACRVEGGPSGEYTLVGWPGMFGILTGVAPGRFSVTINYVRHNDEGIGGAAKAAMAGAWPVPWLVRRVFEQARDYHEAVKMLSESPLVSSVLFAVAGTTNDQRVIIERSRDAFAHRTSVGDWPLCVTNHYVSETFARSNVPSDDLELIADSADRLRYILEQTGQVCPVDAQGAIGILSNHSGPLLSSITQHQAVMRAATGGLSVRVPGMDPVQIV